MIELIGVAVIVLIILMLGVTACFRLPIHSNRKIRYVTVDYDSP